jgi:hypothetical protein
MMRGLPLLALAVGIAATMALPAAPVYAAPRADVCGGVALGVSSLDGPDALAALGADLPVAAATNHVTASVLAGTLAHDATARLDRCGRLFYAEAVQPLSVSAGMTASPTVAAAGLDASGNAFTLSSRPSSSHTIYLDFTGFALSGTAWNKPYGIPDGRVLAPFDTDGDPAHFSTVELDAIRHIWLSVAEDYAPFDVNVTTALPAAGALERTSLSDQQFGTRAVITNDSSSYAAMCPGGCGGIAYIDVVGITGSGHEYYQPAIVFQRGLSSNVKAIAEATSHEVGHNFGLLHDGSPSGDYYFGAGAWAPIMGASYYRPVTQWSHGEYVGATQKQDDIATIAGHLAVPATTSGFATDEPGIGDDSAVPLTNGVPVAGVISNATDADWWQFTSYGGSAAVSVNPAPYAPDLDVRLDVYAADGALVTTISPATSTADQRVGALGPPIAGLAVAWAVPALPAGHYALRVSGSGSGSAATTGYSSYGSVGRYTIEATWAAPTSLVVASASLPHAVRGVSYSATAVAGGASGAPTWSLLTGTLPVGLSLDPMTGVISGTPSSSGVASFTLEVADDSAHVASRTVSLRVYDPVSVRTTAFNAASLGRRYVAHALAAGGDGTYVWTRSAGALPPGMTLSSSGVVSGTPTRTGRYVFTLRGADYAGSATLAGRYAVRSFSISVAKPVVVRSSALRVGIHRHAYASQLYAVGGSGGYTWRVRAGSLPPGTSLTATGRITGTPTRAGRWIVTLLARDVVGRGGVRTFVLTVR